MSQSLAHSAKVRPEQTCCQVYLCVLQASAERRHADQLWTLLLPVLPRQPCGVSACVSCGPLGIINTYYALESNGGNGGSQKFGTEQKRIFKMLTWDIENRKKSGKLSKINIQAIVPKLQLVQHFNSVVRVVIVTCASSLTLHQLPQARNLTVITIVRFFSWHQENGNERFISRYECAQFANSVFRPWKSTIEGLRNIKRFSILYSL